MNLSGKCTSMMNELTKHLVSLSQSVPGSDHNLVFEILRVYDQLPQARQDFSDLRQALRNARPELFLRSVNGFMRQEFIVPALNSTPGAYFFEALDQGQQDRINELKQSLEKIFPATLYTCSWRIKDQVTLEQNIRKYGVQRALIDVVGVRIVPRRAEFLPSMINQFEKAYTDPAIAKLNTLAYGDEEITRVISLHSLYYRAIHYYLPLGPIFVEIQMRTPAIDQWSILHHFTIYKPKIQLTEAEKAYVIEFGKICNIVDFVQLIDTSTLVGSTKISRHNVAAVIFDSSGKVLLCKRSLKKKIAPGNWHMPGGRIDEGETLFEAIKRELREELSIDVTSIRETPVVHTYGIGDELHQTQYVNAVIQGSIVLNDENDAYIFVEPADVGRYLPADRVEIILRAIGYFFE